MDNDKWKKYHDKGYKSFMLTHLAVVVGFFTFTCSIAYVQMSMTMPPSLQERGVGLPLWPIGVVVFVMIPLSIVYSHFLWKFKEKGYEEREKNK